MGYIKWAGELGEIETELHNHLNKIDDIVIRKGWILQIIKTLLEECS